MNKTKRFDLKTIFTILAMLMLSLSMVLFSACDKTVDSGSSSSGSSPSSSSTTEEETVTDYQTLTNGDFEFGTDKTDKEKYPVNTGINWSRANDSLATSASTSDYTSGIIDTEDEAYKAIAGKQAFPILSGEGDNAVYFNPRTPFYYGLVEKSYTFDEKTKNSDKLPTLGTKVLMIHNKVKANEGRGTAQKFTSSKTIDIEADTYNRVSVWVLTKDLKTVQDTADFGAYVSLINTVSTAKSPLIVKNINTNGEWAQVNIYVKGSNLTTSSYRLVLGLGNGSRKVQGEYVEGFAYFDNATVETLTAEEYLSATESIASENKLSLFTADTQNAGLYADTSKTDLVVSATGITYKDNGEKSDSFVSSKEVTKLNYSLSFDIPQTAVTGVYASSKANDVYPHQNSNFNKNVEIGESAFADIASKVSGVKNPVGDNASTLYMIYNEVASQTADTKTFTLNDGESMLLSFYAKIKVGNAQTGVSVNLVDVGTTTTEISEKTAICSSVNTNNYENESSNDWAKFFVFVQNDVGDGKARSFKLSIDFGPTNTVTEYFTLPQGYALFTGFETANLSEEQFKIASSSSSYTGKVNLGKDLPNGAESKEETEENYSLKYANVDSAKIENSLSSSVIDYTGVVGGHTMVGGENTAYTQSETKSGIFNTKYIDNYTELSADEKANLKALKPEGENKNVQALLINNTSATSYGYLGKANTVSANTTSIIAVKVRVFGDAKAYVYLANANPLDGFGVLGLTASKWSFSEADGVSYGSEIVLDKKYVQTVTASECENEWKTVYFSITAGKSDISYRVEVWNGSRDASEKSSGMVVVESVNTSASLNSAQISADNEGGEVKEEKYQRAPTLVVYNDENGKETTKYEHYISSVVFTEYSKAKTIVATHATVDAESSVDQTQAETPSEGEEEATTTEKNPDILLQSMSIIIAIVLIIAVICAAVRIFFKKTTAKEVKINEYYNRTTRDIANEKIAQNKKRRAMEEAQAKADESTESNDTTKAPASDNTVENSDDVQEDKLPEYDYENMENNIPTDEA